MSLPGCYPCLFHIQIRFGGILTPLAAFGGLRGKGHLWDLAGCPRQANLFQNFLRFFHIIRRDGQLHQIALQADHVHRLQIQTGIGELVGGAA